MSVIKPLNRQDYRALFRLSKKAEPYAERGFYDQFCDNLDNRRGFTIWNSDGVLIGLVSYSDYKPGNTVMIHFMNDPERYGSVTRATIQEAFRFPFLKLRVPRLASYSVIGVTDRAGKFLRKLGFRLEGVLKEAGRLPDGLRDVEVFGMLKTECRWL